MSFDNDLKRAAISAAKTLRDSVDTTQERRTKWGLKLEHQMVAETYHLLRNMGKYTPDNLTMEFHYTLKDPVSSKKHIHRPDFIFSSRTNKDQPVEFKVAHRNPVKSDGSLSNPICEMYSEGYKQLLSYSNIENISNLILVVAYLGPKDGFNLNPFSTLLKEYHKKREEAEKRSGKEVLVVPC
ncbi:MAG: hypothetical protein ACYCT2_04630 [Thermoplasmataceae archaeon]